MLVVGRGIDTLDDGEAATVADTAESGTMAILDERTANCICAVRYPQMRLGSTIDLLAHSSVETFLGAASVADAVFAALQKARMRVLPCHLDWLITLIGQDRVQECSSLPRSVRVKNSLTVKMRQSRRKKLPHAFNLSMVAERSDSPA
ncbi:MAG: hypothetical protein HY245_04240 [Rhizobiales bacterium]|nr:hypothetical protein [Hyphomicrobiales bacterium]